MVQWKSTRPVTQSSLDHNHATLTVINPFQISYSENILLLLTTWFTLYKMAAILFLEPVCGGTKIQLRAITTTLTFMISQNFYYSRPVWRQIDLGLSLSRCWAALRPAVLSGAQIWLSVSRCLEISFGLRGPSSQAITPLEGVIARRLRRP